MLAGLAVLGLVGCGDGSTGLTTLTPEIYGEPPVGTVLEFEEVVLERTRDDRRQVLRVGNRGDSTLRITSVRIEGPGADQFRIISSPARLAPGQINEVFFAFEPNAPAEHTPSLVIASNDPDRPEVAWPIRGPAREPCSISAEPAFQNFLLGEIRQVVVSAGPATNCVITGIETDRGIFDIINEPVFPYELAAGTSLTLDVQHTDASIEPSGAPTREFLVRELEGTEARVFLAGEEPLFGCLEAFPTNLNFSRLERGASQTRTVQVRNTCSVDAAVTSVAMSQGFYFYEVDSDAYPALLGPLETLDIPVTYTAFSPQGDRGLMTINNNDARNPRFRIELYGEADLPQAQVIPQGVDFGNVVFKNPQGPQMRSECSSAARVVRVYSTGAAALRIDRLDITDDSDPGFIISSVLVDGQPVFDFSQPIVVPPDGQMDIALQFFPTRLSPSVHTGTLRIANNGVEGVQEVQLRGTGVPSGQVFDMFEQLAGPTVDILWVIDDSCSMIDEQARLVANLSQFVSYADSQNSDYRMAVTVTDSRSSEAGKFERCFPHPAIIGLDYADSMTRQEAFECTFQVGADRLSFFEAGLGAAMRALERATSTTIDPSTNPNANFLRDQAKLAIVTVSDEDDQSAESDLVLRDFFWSVKGGFNRRALVSVHSIAGPVTNPCAQGERFAVPGFRYLWMTQQTDGIFFDICEDDWQPLVRDLGLDVFTPLNEWELSQSADPASLVVTVDGVQVNVDALNGYTYDLATNSIRFNGASVPVPGAQISAEYTGLCRP